MLQAAALSAQSDGVDDDHETSESGQVPHLAGEGSHTSPFHEEKTPLWRQPHSVLNER